MKKLLLLAAMSAVLVGCSTPSGRTDIGGPLGEPSLRWNIMKNRPVVSGAGTYGFVK